MPISKEPQESAWAELREAQLLTSLNLPNTGMAVITDAGDPNDIHPKKKEPAGVRLALAARALAYKEKIEYSGPAFHSMKVQDGKVILSFKHIGGGLSSGGEKLTGFTICGKDRKWVNAQADLKDNKVLVWTTKVAEPVAVRYGWANCPVCNLQNKEGIPASPFRTDDFPILTGPKQIPNKQ
jgi:sialate O-acetylesterase